MPSAPFNRLLLAAILWMTAGAMAQDTGLRQTGIPVEATAVDAVQARDVALAAGRRAALNRLAAAVGASAPSVSDRQIDAHM